jgi:hypothetical protein
MNSRHLATKDLVSSSEKNNIYTTVEKTILSLASLLNKLPRLKKMSSLPWCIITIVMVSKSMN